MVRKVTFTLDDVTIERLQRTAETLKKPKSEVVRDAVADYHDRLGMLTEAERRRLLAIIDRVAATPSPRSNADVRREIAAVREARHTPRGARRHKR